MIKILAISDLQPPVLAAIISVLGVLLTSVFGYISSYYGNQQSQRNELKKIRENQQKHIEQENKLEKDKSLRGVLQKLTYAFYNILYDTDTVSTYFNTDEGLEIFNDVMSYVTAYGSEKTVQTTIYLQKAIYGSHLLESRYSALESVVRDELPYSIDWSRYEINALASILIAQIRYDISSERLNPQDLIAVKYNNDNRILRRFFSEGIDYFIDILELDHFEHFKYNHDTSNKDRI